MKAESFSKAVFEVILARGNNPYIAYPVNEENVCNTNEQTCYICIHDTITNEEPYFKKDHPNVLNLWFDDVEFEISDLKGQKAVPMSQEQAKQILDFITYNKNNGIQYCLIHCTAGVSRSVAVKNFINMYFNTGNQAVLNLLLNEYRKELRNNVLIPKSEELNK